MTAPSVPSIRDRLSRVVLSVTLAWGLGVSAVVWLVVHQQVDRLMENALCESAEVLFATLDADVPALPRRDGGSLPAPAHQERLVWQLLDPQGQLLMKSHQAPAAPLVRPGAEGGHEDLDGWFSCTLKLPRTGRALVVGQRSHDVQDARVGAGLATAAAALAVGLACAAWLRRAARKELRPIDALSTAVEHWHPLQAGEPLAQAGRSELVPLRDAILALGERLARKAANERAVAAHAAHALRTPLAGIVVQLATAQKLAPERAQGPLQQARQAADRLRQVVGALLTLFRSGGELRRQTIALPTLVTHLPTPGVQVHVSEGACIDADADLLAAALANLLDNAQRHGARQVWMRVAGAELSLQDDGPGATPARLSELRSALAGQQYQQGPGLGLMLADLVARAHGGSLQLPSVDAGFAVSMCLGPREDGDAARVDGSGGELADRPSASPGRDAG